MFYIFNYGYSSFDLLLEINEMRVLSAANQFVSLGLKKAGYKYINIDVSYLCMQNRCLYTSIGASRIAGRESNALPRVKLSRMTTSFHMALLECRSKYIN